MRVFIFLQVMEYEKVLHFYNASIVEDDLN